MKLKTTRNFFAVFVVLAGAQSAAVAQSYCGGARPVLKLLTYRDGSVLIKTDGAATTFNFATLT